MTEWPPVQTTRLAGRSQTLRRELSGAGPGTFGELGSAGPGRCCAGIRMPGCSETSPGRLRLRLRQVGRAIAILTDRATLAGITVRLVDERGISSTCPACTRRVTKPRGRTMTCRHCTQTYPAPARRWFSICDAGRVARSAGGLGLSVRRSSAPASSLCSGTTWRLVPFLVSGTSGVFGPSCGSSVMGDDVPELQRVVDRIGVSRFGPAVAGWSDRGGAIGVCDRVRRPRSTVLPPVRGGDVANALGSVSASC